MGRINTISRIIVYFLLIAVAVGAGAVDVNNAPGWLVYEKGKQLFDAGDYGESLYYFRLARDRFGEVPEIEFWIGRIFEAEGQYDLAIRQYNIALENADYFDIRDDAYDLHYRLANIAFARKQFSDYEAHLSAAIDRDAAMRRESGEFDFDKRLLSKSLSEKGLDKLLELYRLPDFGGLAAYYDLGVYKLRTGHNERAVELLSYSIVITISTVVDYLIDLDPYYRFDSLPALLQMAAKRRPSEDYLRETDCMGQLYALALALRASKEAPKVEISIGLLRMVAEEDTNDYWGRRAEAQISSPFDDDFMIVY